MAAKRKSRTTRKAAGKKSTIRVNRAEIDAPLIESVELPASAEAVTDVPVAKPVAPKTGPSPRGGRFTGIGRGQGAPQARRYAFRRS